MVYSTRCSAVYGAVCSMVSSTVRNMACSTACSMQHGVHGTDARHRRAPVLAHGSDCLNQHWPQHCHQVDVQHPAAITEYEKTTRAETARLKNSVFGSVRATFPCELTLPDVCLRPSQRPVCVRVCTCPCAHPRVPMCTCTDAHRRMREDAAIPIYQRSPHIRHLAPCFEWLGTQHAWTCV